MLNTLELLQPEMQRFLDKEEDLKWTVGPFSIRYMVSIPSPTPSNPDRLATKVYKIHPGDTSHLLIGPVEHSNEYGSTARFSMRVPPAAFRKNMDEETVVKVFATAMCKFEYRNRPIVERVVRKCDAKCTIICRG